MGDSARELGVVMPRRVLKPWYRLPTAISESPSLEGLRSRADVVLTDGV